MGLGCGHLAAAPHPRQPPTMPTAVLLAGPNGAGKTTFINQFLRERAAAFHFVNPDEVARGVPAGPNRDLAAGRLVLERLDELVAARADFVLETTLATRSHAVRIREWKAAGYRVELVYLRLPSVEASIAPRGATGRARRPRHPGGRPPPTLPAQPRLPGDGLQAARGQLEGLPRWRRRPRTARLGTEMSLTFDNETVLKALRRAAWVAKHGAREEKSGKFLPPPGWKGHLVTARHSAVRPEDAPKTKRA